MYLIYWYIPYFWANNPIKNILLGYTPWNTEREYPVVIKET